MNGSFDEPITPELVLVDPELAARLRAVAVAEMAHLGEAGSPQPATAAPALSVTPPTPTNSTDAVAADRATKRGWVRVGKVAALIGVAALLGASFARPRDAPSIDESAPASRPSASPAITLAWQPTTSASYYVVEIFRGRRLVHAETVDTDRLPVPAWLAPGRYTWYVRSGSGFPVARRSSEPFEHGWFVVTE